MSESKVREACCIIRQELAKNDEFYDAFITSMASGMYDELKRETEIAGITGDDLVNVKIGINRLAIAALERLIGLEEKNNEQKIQD